MSRARIRALVTGATGFVGAALLVRLRSDGFLCVAPRRHGGVVTLEGTLKPEVGEITRKTQWAHALQGVDVVVHLAARVHVMHETTADPLEEYRETNVHGTLNLAQQAAEFGVRRFVFVSSVKVNGEVTKFGTSFLEDDTPAPKEAYGISKMEAELGLRVIASQTGMEVVIIRPPLVYGAGAKANFAVLLNAVQRGWPLPLGAVHNRRSLVALDNLVDFIAVCTTHQQAANQTFLVSDGQDLSTCELVRGIGRALGVPVRLYPVPVWAVRLMGVFLGKKEAIQRLTGNLQVNISKANRLLGWVPPISIEEGLRRAAAGIRKS